MRRPEVAPEVLTTRGARERQKLEEAFDQAPDEYRDGARSFGFKGALYGHSSVKRALTDAFHGKCCFCEERVGEHGDVEHFRPKGSVCQRAGSPVEVPGYYWLAYEWGNLLLACPVCNQRCKRNLFPLAGAAKRARSHHDGIEDEDPLLIDPAAEDPDAHISFRAEVAFPVGGSPKGQATIDVIGLNRRDLLESRRDRLKHVQALVALSQATPGPSAERRRIVRDARTALAALAGDGEEFAGMVRAARRSGGYLP